MHLLLIKKKKREKNTILNFTQGEEVIKKC